MQIVHTRDSRQNNTQTTDILHAVKPHIIKPLQLCNKIWRRKHPNDPTGNHAYENAQEVRQRDTENPHIDLQDLRADEKRQ